MPGTTASSRSAGSRSNRLRAATLRSRRRTPDPAGRGPNGKQAIGSPNCDPQEFEGTFNPGAKGGEASGLLSGGTGGDWFKPYPYSGTNGTERPENPSVGGGIGGEMYWPGGLGSPGLPGAPGLPGLDSLNRAALIYAPMPGTDGGDGTRGAGGGGGGMSENTCMPGSGGGAGGRPGAGGKGGSGGGGSIGVYVGEGAYALVLDGSVIHAADGGKGGNGGLGQPGGDGGEGGSSGTRNLRSRMGGRHLRRPWRRGRQRRPGRWRRRRRIGRRPRR